MSASDRRRSMVLPPKRLRDTNKMNSDPEDEGAVLPPKDPKQKLRQTTLALPVYMWDQLADIAKASGEYSRNEVIQLFLENRIAAWLKEQNHKKGVKK